MTHKIHSAWLCALLTPIACGVDQDELSGQDDTFDDRPVERAASRPPPVTGGTLLVTRDGAFAVASDPVRDVVHIVDLATSQETATVVLTPGAQPFRGAQDNAGLVHITLRGTGEVIAVNPELGTIVTRTTVCPNPRGIAFDTATNAVSIACAGGDLVHLDADTGNILTRDHLDTDLRDVFVLDTGVAVSRFRTAEVLQLNAEGDAILQGAPLSVAVFGGPPRTPNTAWRTFANPDGGWIMLHQLANTRPLRLPDSGDSSDENGIPGDPFESESSEYGGSAGEPCGGAVQQTISAQRPDGTLVHATGIDGVALVVDVALSPDGHTLVVASPSQHDFDFGNGDQSPAGLFLLDTAEFTANPGIDCEIPMPLDATDDFVAVAFDNSGNVLAQTRERAQLYRFDGDQVAKVIDLVGDDIVDTGESLFHLDAGAGLACASCHPEGGDDGQIWSFVGRGPRRTQPLNVGIEGTDPFHWNGEMADMNALVHEVRGGRMGGMEQADERADALQEWVFSIPVPAPIRAPTDALAVQGQTLFTKFACQTCHAGRSLTTNLFADMGKGSVQIPNLRAVALHAPYMHDGRSATLESATREMIAATPGVPAASDEEVAALVAYLETL